MGRRHETVWAVNPLKHVGPVTHPYHPLCYNSISPTINLTGQKSYNPADTETCPLLWCNCCCQWCIIKADCKAIVSSPRQPACVHTCHQHLIPSCSVSLQSASVCLIEINDNLGRGFKGNNLQDSLRGLPSSIWTSLKQIESVQQWVVGFQYLSISANR